MTRERIQTIMHTHHDDSSSPMHQMMHAMMAGTDDHSAHSRNYCGTDSKILKEQYDHERLGIAFPALQSTIEVKLELEQLQVSEPHLARFPIGFHEKARKTPKRIRISERLHFDTLRETFEGTSIKHTWPRL